MRSSTETLIEAMRILSNDVESEDGIANAAIAEAASRLEEMEHALKTILIQNGNECERSTSGLGSCHKDGRTERAKYGADQVCSSCIASRVTAP